MQTTATQQAAASYLFGGNSAYIEALYEQFLQDPATVPENWRTYFTGLMQGTVTDTRHQELQAYFLAQAKRPKTIYSVATAPAGVKQDQVWQLIRAYRFHGHEQAQLDPLNLTQPAGLPNLTLEHYGLTAADLAETFAAGSCVPQGRATLKDIQAALTKTYCSSIGFEYMYLTNSEEVQWLQTEIESVQAHPVFSAATKKYILEKLTAAEGLEKYLGAKYVGQKRFSLEGGDSLIPLMDTLVQQANVAHQVEEVVIGMAHRGRLNVLVNVLGKAPKQLFDEFEGKAEKIGSGDVKYHMGFSADIATATGAVHVALAFNPSHLEIISPVVEGSVCARQRRRQDTKRAQVVPVLLHGDAAFAGQGVVMENFTLSQARGYKTGGTIHIVVNNQIGFTTSEPSDVRSTRYCTDIAKMVEAPVFHVNADDPEAVVYVAKLALDYRMKFNKDVVIDLVCYRRHGHNEADEPSATQPIMYQRIKALPTARQQYAQQLVAEHVLAAEQADALVQQYRQALDENKTIVNLAAAATQPFRSDWSLYQKQVWTAPANTAVELATLHRLAQGLETLPAELSLQTQVEKLLEDRRQMTAGKLPLNWGYAETLAYATLLNEGYAVRLSGQDSGRGTFAHRHAVLHDYKTGKKYLPLCHVSPGQGNFEVIDSVLSEEAVLGFEYGYATTDPNTLVIWEAQFGDFANGAQVIIDQFLSSGEQKWGRLCGLVMLLPHGYEGQGPEHSSARLERYLQLCAEHNMQVCVPSTPAQIFHLLRRQLLRPFRKPLIIMSPKSLLRHKSAVSQLNDLATGGFQPIIPDQSGIDPKRIERVILCSGKVYYELLDYRHSQQLLNTAIIRIEQLYPFPQEALTTCLAAYTKVEKVIWCQEEPQNQGAWYCSQHHMRQCLAKQQILYYAGRPASASPAAGYASLHQAQQAALCQEAFAK